jgi:hypothetical protein
MNKSRTVILLSILIIVTVGVAAFLYLSFPSTLEAMQLNDPSDDVLLSVGSSYPKAVDITGATLEVNRDQANLTIRTNAQNISINYEGTIIWEAVLIFENQTDVVKTYNLRATLNSTGLFCSIQDVEEETPKNCDIHLQQNKLFISAPLEGLAEFEQVEWSITSTYEESIVGELTTNAFDFAPDEGLHITTVQPQIKTP